LDFGACAVFIAFLQDLTGFLSHVATVLTGVHNSDHVLSGDDARNAHWLRVA